MERQLTFFDAQAYREMGFKVTQLTFEATSLHAAERYSIEVAPPEAPEPQPVTTRVIEGSWDDLFAPSVSE